MKRKDFIKTTGRILILGGLAGTAGYLAGNHKVDTTCSVSPACQECRQFSDCKLPQAIEAKQHEQPDGKDK